MMATKSRSKFSPLKKRNDESEAGDHEIMNISYTSASSSGTFKEGIMNHNVFNYALYSLISMNDT